MIKKLLVTLFVLLGIPAIVFGATVGWTRTGTILTPLFIGDTINISASTTAEFNGMINSPFLSSGVTENYLLQTEVLGTTWVRWGGVGAVSANNVMAPTRAVTAEVIPASATDTGGSIAQYITNAVKGYWTFSVWLLATTSPTMDIPIVVGAVNAANSTTTIATTTCRVTSNWSRCAVTMNDDSTHTRKYVQINNGTNQIAAWGAQLNRDSFAYPYSGALTTSAQALATETNTITGYSIAGTSVLTASTLGSGVTASSLTSLGTIAALVVTREGIGTSTPGWVFQIATSSSAANNNNRGHIAITDNVAPTNSKHYVLSTKGGEMTISTSSDAVPTLGTAVVATSSPYFKIKNGYVGVPNLAVGSTYMHSGSQANNNVAIEGILMIGMTSTSTANTAIYFDPSGDDASWIGGTLHIGTGLNSDGDVRMFGGAPFAFYNTDNSSYVNIYNSSETTGQNFLDINVSGASDLVIDNSGRIGIGTSTPQNLLALNSSAFNATVLSLNNSYNQASNRNWAIALNQYEYGDFHIMQGSAQNSPAISGTSRLVIENTGNVGVGTTSPGSKLEVFGASGQVVILDSTTAGGAYTTTKQNSVVLGYEGGGASILTNAAANSMGIRSQGAYYIGTGGDNVRLTVDSVGKVGIGTTSPYAQLSVAGQVVGDYFTGTSTTATSTLSNTLDVRKTVSASGIGNIYPDGETGTPAIFGSYEVAAPASSVLTGIFGTIHNTGSAVGGTGHVIGILGKALDDATGKHTLYGVEGRVDGTGSAGDMGGVFAFSRWTGASFTGRQAFGTLSRVEVTTDGSTPLNEGLTAGVFVPAISGGAPSTRYSFWGEDPLRIDATYATSTFGGSIAIDSTGLTYNTYSDIVGVGTVTVTNEQNASKLTVEHQTGSGDLRGLSLIVPNAAGNTSSINFGVSVGSNQVDAARITAPFKTDSSGVELAFHTYDIAGGTNLAERMRLTGAGKLGIGTTTPNWTLQVTSATPYLAITDSDAGTNSKHWLMSAVDGIFRIGTSSDALNATSSLFSIDTTGMTSYKIPYAQLSSGQDQTCTLANTAYPITLDTNDYINGLTHSTSVNNATTTIDYAGVYEITMSPVVETDTASKHFAIWLRVDNQDIASSSIIFEPPVSSQGVPTQSILYNFSKGQNFQLRMASDDAGTKIDAVPAGSIITGVPASQSIIITIKKVSN